MRKPSLTSPCVADRYSGQGERRAEFSFPERAGSGNLPGGLLLLKDRGPDVPPLVQIYRDEGCEIRTTALEKLHDIVNAAFAVVDADGSPEAAIAALAAVLEKHFPEDRANG